MTLRLIELLSRWNASLRRGFRPGALAVTLAASLLVACKHDQAMKPYATWATAPQDYNEPLPIPAPPYPAFFKDQTIRQVVYTSIGGEAVRVRFSNVFGKTPLTLAGAHLARSMGGSSIAPASDTALTFNGQASVTIPAGGEQWSDAVKLKVGEHEHLAVSMFLAAETPAATAHMAGMQTNYVTAGNALSNETLPDAEKRPSYYYISGVDVFRPTQVNVVVAFGDSITDGFLTTPDTNSRWPNFLSRRLQSGASAGTVSVVNTGISGGRITRDMVGPKALDRFDRDALGQSGVTHVIILLGINDIAYAALDPRQEVAVSEMTASTQSLIDRAKAKGVKVLVGTLLPFKGATLLGKSTYSDALESNRQAFNAWVRANKTADGVIDFDQLMRDPADPQSLLPAYDSGDHLHPNDKGAEAMANAMELRLLTMRP